MTLYKAMSAVKRRELEAEIERLRNLGFDSVDREEKLREQLERQSKALTEAYAAIEAYKGKPVMLHRDMEELARLRAEVGQLHVLRADLENAQRLARIQADEHEKLKAKNAELRKYAKGLRAAANTYLSKWHSELGDECHRDGIRLRALITNKPGAGT